MNRIRRENKSFRRKNTETLQIVSQLLELAAYHESSSIPTAFTRNTLENGWNQKRKALLSPCKWLCRSQQPLSGASNNNDSADTLAHTETNGPESSPLVHLRGMANSDPGVIGRVCSPFGGRIHRFSQKTRS